MKKPFTALLVFSIAFLPTLGSFSRVAHAAGAVICPLDQPGAPLSAGETAFLRDLNSNMSTLHRQTCSTPDGLDCELVNWSAHQATLYPECAGFFFDTNGKEGPLGKLITSNIKDDIDKNGTGSAFMRDYPDLEEPNVCPGFKTMTPSEKTLFWSWFFEILGFFETSCNPNLVDHRRSVPNPPAVGLYQMEERPSLRQWRAPSCGVSVESIHTAEGNTACALDIMRSSMNHQNQVFGSSRQKSYWYALNPDNDVHDRMMRYLPKFPLCKPEGEPTQSRNRTHQARRPSRPRPRPKVNR